MLVFSINFMEQYAKNKTELRFMDLNKDSLIYRYIELSCTYFMKVKLVKH